MSQERVLRRTMYNKGQEIAIKHKEGPMLVLAGPGSGKTYVITKRIEYLIKEYQVRPEEILVITFTKYAANEMQMRFQRENQKLPVTFGTFHGVFYGILRWAYRIDASNILTEDQRYKLLTEILNQVELEVDLDPSEEKEFIASVSRNISLIKNGETEFEQTHELQCTREELINIYEHYERERKNIRKFDFDDMILECHKLFLHYPDALKQWQEKFKYILVDEFQDINLMQYDTIRMLASPKDNLFVVGDDDQSIYGFRGSRPEIMLGFSNDYKKAKSVTLEVNYRSSKPIVAASLKLIEGNTKRYKKNVRTEQTEGESVHVQEVKTNLEECEYIIKKIEGLKNEGKSYRQIAILFRANIEVRHLVGKFIEYGIPFQMREHISNIYEHFVAKNLMTYMRLAMGEVKRGDILEVMNRPNRYISREAVSGPEVSFQSLSKFYCDKEWMLDRIDQWELDLRLIRKMTPYGAIQYIRKSIGYNEFLRDYCEYRNYNHEELLELMEEIMEQAKSFKTFPEWFTYVEEYGERLKKQTQQQKKNVDSVSLHTMHGAKGLEFDYTFIIAANEGVTPSKKAKLDSEIEEERRMFYVAMTRAKKKLEITYPLEKNGKEIAPSRFIHELLL